MTRVARHAGSAVVRDGEDAGSGGRAAVPPRAGTGRARLAPRPLGVRGQRHTAATAPEGRLVLLRSRHRLPRVASPGQPGHQVPHPAARGRVSLASLETVRSIPSTPYPQSWLNHRLLSVAVTVVAAVTVDVVILFFCVLVAVAPSPQRESETK